MKRFLRLGAVAVGAMALEGCPIFPDEPYACLDDWDCASGYACNTHTGNCELVILVPDQPERADRGIAFCDSPDDCRRGETCTRAGVCAVGSCALVGYACVAGYECRLDGAGWSCLPDAFGAGGAGGAPGEGGDAGGASSAAAPGAGAAPLPEGGATAAAAGAPAAGAAGGAGDPPIAGAPLT